MSRYIDGDTLFNEVTACYRRATGEARKAYRNVLDMICAVDNRDVQEVKCGKWEQRGKKIYCSYCNNGFEIRFGARPMSVYPYCPVCGSVRTNGAKMDGKDNEE